MWVEEQVFDRVASLPQVKGNLASCREREQETQKKEKGKYSLLYV